MGYRHGRKPSEGGRRAAPRSGAALRGRPSLGGSAAERHRVDQVRVAELPQRLPLDQPHTLAGKTEHLAGLPEAQGLPVLEAVAKRHDVAFPLIQDLVDGPADLLTQELVL